MINITTPQKERLATKSCEAKWSSLARATSPSIMLKTPRIKNKTAANITQPLPGCARVLPASIVSSLKAGSNGYSPVGFRRRAPHSSPSPCRARDLCTLGLRDHRGVPDDRVTYAGHATGLLELEGRRALTP